jgi:hypothetical protein
MNEHDRIADEIETQIRHENYRLESRITMLTGLLAEAWELGSDHRMPSFGQLNTWHHAITHNE